MRIQNFKNMANYSKQVISKTLNRWKEYHEYLQEVDNDKWNNAINGICENLGISVSTYYRRMSKPKKLSNAEKVAIATTYQLPIHFLFPEMEAA